MAVGCVPRSRPTADGTGGGGPARAPSAGGASTALGKPVTPDAPLGTGFQDDFERAELGANWRSRIGVWRLEEGQLCVASARNRPLWLARVLPDNASIEFSARAGSAEGDIKVELWGDGASAATGNSYNDATSYLAILGGWRNSLHVLARLDEHAPNRLEIKLEPNRADSLHGPVIEGRTYRFRIERRDGRTLQWFVDDQLVLGFPDPEPLRGPGHDHFGFNNWQARVCFDDVRVSPR
jgi:hypothetical protein